jgi:hypothetical protein
MLSPSTCHHAQAALLLTRILTMQVAVEYHKDLDLMRAIGGGFCAVCYVVVLDVHANFMYKGYDRVD